MTHVALIGAGVVGSSWALVFTRAGQSVTVYDPAEASLGKIGDFIQAAAKDQPDAAACLARLTTTTSLERALDGANYVQESVPERLEIKQPLYLELDRLAAPDAILASSTSGFPASSFTEPLGGRHRCLVVHPINPPHLIPLVEIVPAPWTAPEVVTQAAMQWSVNTLLISMRKPAASTLIRSRSLSPASPPVLMYTNKAILRSPILLALVQPGSSRTGSRAS